MSAYPNFLGDMLAVSAGRPVCTTGRLPGNTVVVVQRGPSGADRYVGVSGPSYVWVADVHDAVAVDGGADRELVSLMCDWAVAHREPEKVRPGQLPFTTHTQGLKIAIGRQDRRKALLAREAAA